MFINYNLNFIIIQTTYIDVGIVQKSSNRKGTSLNVHPGCTRTMTIHKKLAGHSAETFPTTNDMILRGKWLHQSKQIPETCKTSQI